MDQAVALKPRPLLVALKLILLMALARKWPDLNLDLNRFLILVDLKPRLIPVGLNLDLLVDLKPMEVALKLIQLLDQDRKQHMLPQQRQQL